MDIRILVGRNTARLRRERGWNQEHACELAGLTQSYLSQVENGHVNLTLFVLNDLAEAFGVHPSELFSPLDDASR